MQQTPKWLIGLKIDWRFLLVVGTAMVVLVLALPALSAQGQDPASINSLDAGALEAQTAAPVAPAIECDEGWVATINGGCVPAESIAAVPAEARPAAATASGGAARSVYVTGADFATTAATTACASGYHMASLWEILDISNLRYAYAHPGAERPADHPREDRGSGPPSAWYGWVRTGYNSSGVNSAGVGNCLAWTSVVSTAYGSAVRLPSNWLADSADIHVWEAATFQCNMVGPVWCVED